MDAGNRFGEEGVDIDVSRNPLQDDVSAPYQFSDGIGRARYESAEKQLMLAILSDAVGCVLREKWSRDSAEALAWIVEPNDDALCSFDSVCELLGLNPTYVRRGIIQQVEATRSVPIKVDVRGPKRKVVPIEVAA